MLVVEGAVGGGVALVDVLREGEKCCGMEQANQARCEILEGVDAKSFASRFVRWMVGVVVWFGCVLGGGGGCVACDLGCREGWKKVGRSGDLVKE